MKPAPLFAWLWLAVLPAAADATSPDAAQPRRTPSGRIAGTDGTGGSLAWLGIPYAEPPVGERRWRAPVPRRPWQDTLVADRFRARCPQQSTTPAGQVVSSGSEDCLFLNVWAPGTGGLRVRRPVLFWIHSGANVSRAGSDFDGSRLAVGADAVVVTINYRLATLGWFRHPALTRLATTPEDASGNFGTLDQLEALRWVRRHIASFGGDPRNVTVFGESAGGWNIYALLASPLSKGLFHRAAIQSGNMPFYTIAQAENEYDAPDPGVVKSSAELLLQLLIDTGRADDRSSAKPVATRMTDTEIAAFLRARSHLELLRAEGTLFARWARGAQAIGQQRYLPGLIRDGSVLPREPFLDLAASGAIPRMPLLLGSNRDEDIQGLVLYSPHLVQRLGPGTYRYRDPEFLALAVDHLGRLWKADGVDEPAALLARDRPVFAYRYDWDEPERTNAVTIVGGSTGAMHGTHVPVLFGTPSVALEPAVQAGFDALSAASMSYWSAFARHDNPGRGQDGSLPAWPAWKPATAEFLVLDSASGGGIRTERGFVSFAAVLEGIRRDRRMADLGTRCRLYWEMANFAFGANHRMGRLSLADYAAVEEGACADAHPASAPANGTQVPPRGTRFQDCPDCPRMVVIPAGSFEMGSTGSDADMADERPRHRVRLAAPFALGALEVTRGQFADFVAATGYDAGDACNTLVQGEWQLTAGRSWRDPGFPQADDHPAVCVSWEDAQAYVAWLSKESGLRYRLPSEAEWEYASRAGGAGDFSWDSGLDHEVANYGRDDCCGGLALGRDRWEFTAPAGSFPANAFGLHDDRGNAWEWLEDCYHENYDRAPADGSARRSDCSLADRRSLRGGSWGDGPPLLRAAYRLRGPTAGRYFTLGFRVARDFTSGT